MGRLGKSGIYTFVVGMGGTLVNWRTSSRTHARLQLLASPYLHDTDMTESTQSTSVLPFRASSQQRSAVVSSSSDQAQGPGHCYPAATPGAGAQGSRRLTAPHPPTQGQYGTRERQAVEPGEPECLWSPAPLDLPGPPWRREDSPGNGHGLLSGVGPASGDLGMPHSPTAQE